MKAQCTKGENPSCPATANFITNRILKNMVFEETACRRADDFLYLNSTLAREQFGLRKNLSTSAVLHVKCFVVL